MSTPARQVLTVPEALRGVQVEDFLAREFPATDRAALRALVTGGQLRVNGMAVRAQQRLLAYDYVELLTAAVDLPSRRPERLQPDGLSVLHEAATELVVDKPAGLPTVPTRDGADGGVHAQLAGLRPDADLRIVHRLDRDTSGCLLLAKGLDAARHYDAAFRTRAVHKRYVALVQGSVGRDRQSIELAIAADPKRPGRMLTARAGTPGARPAQTMVTVLERWAACTLLELTPHTGRSHQLRVHLQAIGHPIVGDTDYGGGPLLLSALKRGYKLRRGVKEHPLLQRMFLHSEHIEFHDPDGGAVAVTAPLPADLRQALAKLMRFGGTPRRGRA